MRELYRVTVRVEYADWPGATDEALEQLSAGLDDVADAIEDFARERFRQWRKDGGGVGREVRLVVE